MLSADCFLPVLAPRPLPRNELSDSRASARGRLLVAFYFLPRCFFSDRADAEADLLLLRTHLDNFELMLHARFQMHLLPIAIHSLGVMAQAFHAFRDLHKRAECCNPQNFAMHNIANPVLIEKGFPNVRLQLLHAQRKASLL